MVLTHVDQVVARLREQGFRMTKARRALIEILIAQSKPLTIEDLQDLLRVREIAPNKTTLYREMDFLNAQNLIRVLDFNEGCKRYEWLSDHHHHLVCEVCGRVEDVSLDELEALLPVIEERMKKAKPFPVVRHALEFFGICENCHVDDTRV